MPAANQSLRTAVARSAAARRWNRDDPEARRDLATERLAAYIAKVVSEAPPLTSEQRERLSLLLAGARRG